MAGAIPTEPGAASLLASSRAAAVDSLRSLNPKMADALGGPPTPGGGDVAAPNNAPTVEGPSDESLAASEQEPMPEFNGPAEQTPEPSPVQEHGTGDLWDPKNVKEFLHDTFKGTGTELANAMPRVGAKLGQLITMGGAGLAAVVQGGINKATGKDSTAITDAIFDFKKNYVDPAVDYWTPKRQVETGDTSGVTPTDADTGTGPAAQAIGSGSEAIPYMVTGGAGLVSMIANAFNESATGDIDAGKTVTQAVTDGAVDAIGNAAMLAVGSRDPGLLRRIIKTIPAGDTVAVAQNLLKKGILTAEGNTEAADKVQWNDGLGEATVQNGVFGFFRKPPKEGKAAPKPSGPSAESSEAAGPITETPPSAASTAAADFTVAPDGTVTPATAAAPPAAASATPAAAPKPVMDKPSAEPVKDLVAQFKAMNDEERDGVFLSKANLNNLATTKNQQTASITSKMRRAVKESRAVTTDAGVLILRDASDAKAARQRLAGGEDPQKVIGDYTGAGEGKNTAQTAVVQGQTPEGAVVSESAVTPAEVPAKVDEVQAAGHEPVVTTPEAAQARRTNEIAAEQQPVAEAKPLTVVGAEATPAAEVATAAPEQVPPTVEAKSTPKVEAVESPKAAEPIAEVKPAVDKTSDEYQAKQAGVSVEAFRAKREADAAKAVAAAERASAGPEIRTEEQAPAAGKESTAGETATTTLNREEPTPAVPSKAKAPKTALEALPEALATHEQQEAPVDGQKHAAPLAERQDNASAFALVLKQAAKDAVGKAPVEAIERATAAAKSAERLTEKGLNATKKGQGTSHVRVTAIVSEMHKAARGLLDASKPGDEVVVKPKEAELKAKTAKAREKAAVPKEGTQKPKKGTTVEPKIEHPVNEKYKAQLEPKKQGASLQNEALRVKTRFVNADEADMPKVRAETEQWLHDTLGSDYTKEQLDEAMRHMEEARAAENPNATPRRMSDTVQEAEHEFDPSEAYENGMGKTYNPSLRDEAVDESASRRKPTWLGKISSKLEEIRQINAANRFRDELKGLRASFDDAGWTAHFQSMVDSGKHVGTHEMLDKMIAHTDTPILRSMLKAIRAHAPDAPIFFVTDAKDLQTGEALPHSAGLYYHHNNVIQIRGDELTRGTSGIRTIVHEIVHAATAHELDDPTSPVYKAFNEAYNAFIQRLGNKYGEKEINDHILYFQNPRGMPKPEGYMGHLYGIANTKEFASEVLTNPRFIEEVADSEQWKIDADERHIHWDTYMGRKPTLLGQMLGALGRFFFGKAEPKLLQHLGNILEDTMASHADTRGGKSNSAGLHLLDSKQTVDLLMSNKERDILGASVHDPAFIRELNAARKAARGIRALSEDPPPVRGIEAPLARLVDEDEEDEGRPRPAIDAVRSFLWATKNRTASAIRAVVPGLNTESELYRDYTRDFGSDEDPTNPARQVQDVKTQEQVTIKRITDLAKGVGEAWARLGTAEDTAVGALLRDATMNKIDPRFDPADQTLAAQVTKGFAERHAQYQTRLAKLSPEAQKVFGDTIDTNKRIRDEERHAGVDTAVATFGADLTPAQTKMLYNAHGAHDYEALIGHGAPIDIGEDNDKLRRTLADFSSVSEIEGPYAHLGRHGEHVVSAESEGSREFDTEAQAKKFAQAVDELNPNSRSNIVVRGGKHVVDYKGVRYVSMHDNVADALADRDRMERAGFNMGAVTRKTLGRDRTPLGGGMQELLTEAERKINRNGTDTGTEALVSSLHSAFLQIIANRSAYAGSRLARKNVAGVKASEMRRNFSEHVLSTAWHTAQMRHVFEKASAMAKLRAAARDARGGASQHTLDRRGTFVRELGLRAMQEQEQYGKKNALNSVFAKLGFMNFLASPSHAALWMTQNLTTGIPVAGARWGYGRAVGSFASAMKLTGGPAFRSAMHAQFSKLTKLSDATRAIHDTIVEAVKNDPRFGKWARGENSALQQLIDRGVINHSYSEQLRRMAGDDANSKVTNAILDYSRVLPLMADQFNRISTALVGLEMTGGDIRKAGDFVDEVHANYGSANKPRFFKTFARIPGGGSITMFKTYVQAMAHLSYGNLYRTIAGGGEGRAMAAKISAGLILGSMMFAGASHSIPEPIKALIYGAHKAFGDDEEGDTFDLDTEIHRFLVAHFGEGVGNALANGPVPNALGVDLSSRMGLSDLVLHDPPDKLLTDSTVMNSWIGQQAGAMLSMFGTDVSNFTTHMRRGEPFQAAASAVPVKAFQDMIKAYQLATTGKQTGTGMSITDPSAKDAAVQALGFRPSNVAVESERRDAMINEAVNKNDARKTILKDAAEAFNSGRGTGDIMARIASFNRRFPDRYIKGKDISSVIKYGYKDEAQENQVGF